MYIIHLAALVAVNRVEQQPFEAYAVNVDGTSTLVSEATRLESPPWVFVASTSHVYKSGANPLVEADTLAPQNIYAETKLLAEMTADFFARHRPLRLCIGRIFSFYHASQVPPFLLATITDRLRTHDPTEAFVVRNGLDVRDLSNAESIAELIVRLALANASGTINIGSGIPTRIIDFVQGLAGDRLQVVAEQECPPTCLVADITRMREALDAGRT